MNITNIVNIEAIKLKRPANFILLTLMLLIYAGITASTYMNVTVEATTERDMRFL